MYPPDYHSDFDSQHTPHSTKISALKKLKREKVKPGNEAMLYSSDPLFLVIVMCKESEDAKCDPRSRFVRIVCNTPEPMAVLTFDLAEPQVVADPSQRVVAGPRGVVTVPPYRVMAEQQVIANYTKNGTRQRICKERFPQIMILTFRSVSGISLRVVGATRPSKRPERRQRIPSPGHRPSTSKTS